MNKTRFKVIINWQGEVLTIYRHATSPDQALRLAIREVARQSGYSAKYVRDYVMNSNFRRWEVEK
ncbi:MAG: hypothetical protein KKH70_20275 [Gammaproteobacteria bacterium]|nr:hypothetical protein [Gammaproteobacteria bacterium]MBU2685855.1 hypothetical protein [Gammaproteobacteria bacterium]